MMLPRNIPVRTAAGEDGHNLFRCFRLTKPVLIIAGTEKGSEWPFPHRPGSDPLAAASRHPGPAGPDALSARPSPPASSLLPWHLLLSITADLEN